MHRAGRWTERRAKAESRAGAAYDEGEVDLEEERCVGIAETSLREGIYAEETSRVLWSRVDVDGGGDVSGGSVKTAEASLRETDSEETRRLLRSHCSA